MFGEGNTVAAKAEPFGRLLLKQRDQGDWLDCVADAARADRQFPKDGDPEAVRKRLREISDDGDAFAAIDDAEIDWVNY